MFPALSPVHQTDSLQFGNRWNIRASRVDEAAL